MTITLVCGPPGSGKSTLVRENAQPGDLIVDLDAIKEAISGQPAYTVAPPLLPFAMAARDAVMQLRRTCSPAGSTWIIACAPTQNERDEIARTIGQVPEVVVLAVPAAECVGRIAKDPRRGGVLEEWLEWRDAVDRWWKRYEPPTGTLDRIEGVAGCHEDGTPIGEAHHWNVA